MSGYINKGKIMPLFKHNAIKTQGSVISLKPGPHSFDKWLRKFQSRSGRDAPTLPKISARDSKPSGPVHYLVTSLTGPSPLRPSYE
jgi:hypothetical protein